jgi:hypothetical protein
LNWIHILKLNSKPLNWCKKYRKFLPHFHHLWLWCWKKSSYEKTNLKIHLFIPFRANSRPIFILLKWNYINFNLNYDQTGSQLDISLMWTRLCYRVLVFVLRGHQLSSCRRRILCYHYLLVITMTILRRLMSLSRKLCLFVYYVKHVDNKQWVPKGGANIQWRGRVGRCMTSYKEEFKGKCRQVYWFCWLCCKRVKMGACWD